MSAPVKHTCFEIDASIKKLKEIKHDAQDIEDKITRRAIEHNADHVIDDLEQLRKANVALRDWGEGLERQLSEKEDEIDILSEQIKSLEIVNNEF